MNRNWTPTMAAAVALLCIARDAAPQTLPDTVEKVKPSIVGVGTYYPTRQPPGALLGTGFVVGDGRHIITSAHVFRGALEDPGDGRGGDSEKFTVVFHRGGESSGYRHVTRVREDLEHDIALLRVEGDAMPALELDGDGEVREGQTMAFTGFPLGAVLGLYPVTHQAIVSSITPIAIPQPSADQLDGTMIARLRNRFPVYQLDAIAYPGNSGSPLYDPATGIVHGIVNSVFVKSTKEKALRSPSGITYAMPIEHARKLLDGIE